MVPKARSALASIVINFPFVLGELFLVLASFVFRDYRDATRFAFGANVLLLLTGFCSPESPRWLVAKKR